MGVSRFARFKGGFPAPRIEDGPESLETTLEAPAVYLATELEALGIRCSAPEWFDYEYEILCSASGRQYRLSVSFDFIDWEWFEISYPASLGAVARFFGRNEEPVLAKLSHAVDTALRTRESVYDLRWYAKPLGDAETGFRLSP